MLSLLTDDERKSILADTLLQLTNQNNKGLLFWNFSLKADKLYLLESNSYDPNVDLNTAKFNSIANKEILVIRSFSKCALLTTAIFSACKSRATGHFYTSILKILEPDSIEEWSMKLVSSIFINPLTYIFAIDNIYSLSEKERALEYFRSVGIQND